MSSTSQAHPLAQRQKRAAARPPAPPTKRRSRPPGPPTGSTIRRLIGGLFWSLRADPAGARAVRLAHDQAQGGRDQTSTCGPASGCSCSVRLMIFWALSRPGHARADRRRAVRGRGRIRRAPANLVQRTGSLGSPALNALEDCEHRCGAGPALGASPPLRPGLSLARPCGGYSHPLSGQNLRERLA